LLRFELQQRVEFGDLRSEMGKEKKGCGPFLVSNIYGPSGLHLPYVAKWPKGISSPTVSNTFVLTSSDVTALLDPFSTPRIGN
jgi:hypothetical protein